MTPAELSRTVLHAVRRAVDAGQLSVTPPERVVVTPPGPGGCGDYATNVALQLARPAGRTPLAVAEVLRPYLVGTDGITDVVVTGPGFLNFSLYDAAPVALVQEILRRGSRYGFVDGPRSGRAGQNQAGQGQAGQGQGGALIHCVRDVRAVVVMDAVARILRSQGVPVLTRCSGHPHPEWERILGVGIGAGVDSVGSPPTPGATVLRPVPAPADPLPLGRDAGRWALLHPAAHDRPLIGDEHLVQRESNPLFRVRYAHARSRALVRNAADLGFAPEPGPVTAAGVQSLLAALADHPRVLAAAARQHAPDRLARHLVTVADAALPLLPTVLPRGAEKPSAAHRARLALAEAAGTVLAGGLSLLGIDAPDHL
ncbi:hypothetical protein H0H10_34490 [Streptomyces sp. TRM S81-3]|uniref:arginine--tRNA ligase n=1 Tax=Streptomyces griseicoloratus TaxID=2752516 RepID=A0A926L7S8_9ACTN|nr:DALR anticodon-binding domain-containing protein [Streptomyces griseicoloratus]MBD0424215.1 hypothetical protein [Streptomyces griseicoloratus]